MKEKARIRQKVREPGKGLSEEAKSEEPGSEQPGQKALNEEACRALFENSVDGIFLTRPDGRIEAANPAACKILGMTEEEIIRAGRDGVLNLKDPRVAVGLEERARTGKTEGVITFLRKDGNPFPVEFHSYIYRDRRGELHAFTLFRDISERCRVEEAVRRSEERFSAIFHGSPIALALAHLKDSRLIDVNEAWEKMTGFTREEVIGHTSRELKIIVNSPHREEIIRTLREPDAERSFGAQIRYKSGRIINALMSAKRIEMAGERYVLTLAQDISILKETEKALRESEDRYRTVVEDQTEVIIRFSGDGTITFVNEVFFRFFRKTREELIGKKWYPLAVPEDLPTVEKQLHTLSAANPVVVIENRVYSGAGQVHWMQFVNRGFFDSKGRLVEIQAVGRDITQRKSLEQQLTDSAGFRRAVLDALSANVAVIDETGKVLAVNKAWRDFAAANPPVLQNVCEGANYLQVCAAAKGRHSAQAIPFLKAIRKVFSGELNYFEMEYPCHSPDQKRWFCGRVTPLPGDGPPRAVIAHENITDRKRAERMVKLYQKKLRAMGSELVLAAGKERRYLAGEVHDRIAQSLGLAKIKLSGFSKFGLSPQRKSSLDEIGNLIGRLIEETRSLIFEISPPILYELGMEAAVEWLAERFQEQQGLPVELEIKGKGGAGKDDLHTLLFQAVRELLTNIRKHSKAKHAKIILDNSEKEIRITVSDDGVGFASPSGGRKELLKSFGLFNIQEQIKHIGGKFKIVSSPGKGTKATLIAPKKGWGKPQKRGPDENRTAKTSARR